MKIDYVEYQKWAGYRIIGTAPVALPSVDRHVDRAVYLVAQLEAPKWGSVQSYDGVGMSAGLLHNIAVNRDGTQSSLFQLVREIYDYSRAADHIIERLCTQRDWDLTEDGRVRDYGGGGAVVSGKDLVNELTGPKGVAAKSGPSALRAKEWIQLFHFCFSDPTTFNIQRNYAIRWLLSGRHSEEDAVYRAWALRSIDKAMLASMTEMTPELDLAFCVYHAFSVNAPGTAVATLTRLRGTSRGLFAAKLIRGLGTSKYARWADTTDNKNRYDRTRLAVKKSGLWPRDVVQRLMPENF